MASTLLRYLESARTRRGSVWPVSSAAVTHGTIARWHVDGLKQAGQQARTKATSRRPARRISAHTGRVHEAMSRAAAGRKPLSGSASRNKSFQYEHRRRPTLSAGAVRRTPCEDRARYIICTPARGRRPAATVSRNFHLPTSAKKLAVFPYTVIGLHAGRSADGIRQTWHLGRRDVHRYHPPA